VCYLQPYYPTSLYHCTYMSRLLTKRTTTMMFTAICSAYIVYIGMVCGYCRMRALGSVRSKSLSILFSLLSDRKLTDHRMQEAPGETVKTQNTRMLFAPLAYCLHFYRAMLAQSAVMRLHVVRLSVCLSVTIRYRDHIGWNSSKIISRPNSLRPLLWLTPNMGDLVQRKHPQN